MVLVQNMKLEKLECRRYCFVMNLISIDINMTFSFILRLLHLFWCFKKQYSSDQVSNISL